jgi:hypothetical protein
MAGAPMALAMAGSVSGFEAASLRCSVETACTAAGACAEGAGSHALRLRPVFARGDGSTRLEIEIDGRLRDGSAVTDGGPILWTEGGDGLQTLHLLGDGAALWHRPGAAPPVVFLACEAAG